MKEHTMGNYLTPQQYREIEEESKRRRAYNEEMERLRREAAAAQARKDFEAEQARKR